MVALAVFESVCDGTARWDSVFIMYPDELIRRYVDDEDFEFWLKMKEMHS